jgi:hypothetical protein
LGGTAAASAAAYFARGDIDPMIAGPVRAWALSSARCSEDASVSGKRLRLLFVMVLIALAAQMLLSAVGSSLTADLARLERLLAGVLRPRRKIPCSLDKNSLLAQKIPCSVEHCSVRLGIAEAGHTA